MKATWQLIRCKIGIALKLAGCALIHGMGNHLYGPAREICGMRVAACRSCGKYASVDDQGRVRTR